MRKPFVAGNWKMNKNSKEAVALVTEMLPGLQAIPAVERVIIPPYPALMSVSCLLENSGVGLGAQNLFWEPSGAYTGEVSAAMVREFCQYALVGHSERRTYFGETDESVNRKTRAALEAGLVPIVCVGETLEEYESGRTAEVVTRQVRLGLQGLQNLQQEKIIVAYEPVWAIGSGRPSSAENANQVVHKYIRPPLEELFGSGAAAAIRVLYGGSVKPDNAAEFFGQPEIDGGLLGGASLKAADFISVTFAASRRG